MKTISSETIKTIVDLIPEKADMIILERMKKRISVRGFRTSKIPFQQIHKKRLEDPNTGLQFLKETFIFYYPNIPMKNDLPSRIPQNEEGDSEKLPGKIAAHLLKRNEDESAIMEEFSTELETYRKMYFPVTEEEPTEIPDPEISQEDKPTEIPEDEISHNEESSDIPEPEISQKEPEKKFSGMEYIGYIQIKNSAKGGSSYYNFYPMIRIDEYGKMRGVSESERITEFPDFGNINISAKKWYDLKTRFQTGKIYIIEIDDYHYYFDDNYRSNGTLNTTKYKLDFDKIKNDKLLHDPHKDGFHFYQIYKIPDFIKKINERKPIQISPYDESMIPNDEILVQDAQGRILGPFPVQKNRSAQYTITPSAAEKKFIFDVYRISDIPEAILPLQYENGYIGEIANLDLLACQKEDLMSDETLQQEIRALSPANGGEAAGNEPSILLSTGLPEEIAGVRKERVEKFFQKKRNLNELYTDFGSVVRDTILDAANNEPSKLTELIRLLSEDEDFMNRFSKSRVMTEALQKKQTETSKKIQQLEDEIAQKTIERDRAASEAEEYVQHHIEEREKQLQEIISEQEEREAIYLNNLKKYALADDIAQLRMEDESLKEIVSKKRSERDELNESIQELEQHFDRITQKPLTKVAEIMMNRRISNLISGEVCGLPETDLSASETNDHIEYYIQKCGSLSISDEALLSTLLERFKTYRINYTITDILNLYICFTQGFLTVFAGAPGIGKTSACSILAHSIGLDQKEFSRFIPISVERGWSSKRDFIGYYNPLTKKTDQTNESVYRALEISNEECQRKPDLNIPPMTILLDEANLSPMEYYWAAFMNASDASSNQPKIDLGNGKTFKLSKTLRFMATINNDHTTENLSPRLIDRAWVITLPTGGQFKEVNFGEPFEPISITRLQNLFGKPANPDEKEDPAYKSILDNVYKICRDGKMEINERAKGAVKYYCQTGIRLYNAANSDARTGGVIAADYAISQRILPKILGHGDQYREELLQPLSDFLSKNKLDKSAEILEKIINEGDDNMNYYHFFAS